MKISKILSTVLCALCALVVFGATACTPDAGDNRPVLDAPVLSLDHNYIVWDRVENADSYEVFENGTSMGEQSNIFFYEITRTEGGTYKYAVKAISTDGTYAASPLSAEVTYVIPDTPIALEKPVISLDDNGTLTWAEVYHADGYNVYQNGELMTSVTTTSYTIIQEFPGAYEYAVTATCSLGYYTESELSDAKTFVVAMHANIGVNYSEEYPSSSITVQLYSGETLVDSKTVDVNELGTSTAEFAVDAGEYTAKAADLAEGYVATYAHITATNRNGAINVIKQTAENTVNLGENKFTTQARPETEEEEEEEEIENEVGVTQKFVFTATQTGIFSLTTEETKDMAISVNDKLLLDVAQNKLIGTFRAEEGEVVIISVVGYVEGEFSYNILDYEVKQYIQVSASSNNEETPWAYNLIDEDCTRYINIETAGAYTFFFTTPTIGTSTVTIKIGDREYSFNGGDNQANIELPEGNDIMLEISITGGDNSSIAFAVFKA